MKAISVIKTALSFLFPPRSDEVLVNSLASNILCEIVAPKSQDGVTTLLPYSNELVRSVLWEAKFHHNEKAIALLALALAEYLKYEKDDWVLVPIPLAPKRLAMRGYNQCELIVRETVSTIGRGAVVHGLKKVRETPPQTSLARNMRLSNIEGAFAISHPDKLRDKKVFIIDDVTTTGATLREARRAFDYEAFPSVTCIALTRAG